MARYGAVLEVARLYPEISLFCQKKITLRGKTENRAVVPGCSAVPARYLRGSARLYYGSHRSTTGALNRACVKAALRASLLTIHKT